jgi:hypothetical protein
VLFLNEKVEVVIINTLNILIRFMFSNEVMPIKLIDRIFIWLKYPLSLLKWCVSLEPFISVDNAQMYLMNESH